MRPRKREDREGRREGEKQFPIDLAAFSIFFASSFALFALSRSHLFGAKLRKVI
jgi:hypothetical protein